MRALVLPKIDQPPTLEDRPTPDRPAGHVRVRLAASALNHRDVWIMRGKYPAIRTPVVLGSDGYGEVVEADGRAFVGQKVIIDPGLGWGDDPDRQDPGFSILGMPKDGTFAEEVVVPVRNIYSAPDHLDAVHAAALPLAGVTAWRALMTRAALKPGEKVLITGIGGGVALAALQFAVAHGAHVWCTSSSPAKLKRAAALGASGGALYTDDDWDQQLRKELPAGADVVIDSAGGDGVAKLVGLLAMGGRLAFYGGGQGRWPKLLPPLLFFKQASLLGSTMGSPAEFKAMVEFVAKHEISPVVDRTYDLAEGAQAFADMEAGKQFGKLVLTH